MLKIEAIYNGKAYRAVVLEKGLILESDTEDAGFVEDSRHCKKLFKKIVNRNEVSACYREEALAIYEGKYFHFTELSENTIVLKTSDSTLGSSLEFGERDNITWEKQIEYINLNQIVVKRKNLLRKGTSKCTVTLQDFLSTNRLGFM